MTLKGKNMINRNQSKPDASEIRIVPESELAGEGQAKTGRKPRRRRAQSPKTEEGMQVIVPEEHEKHERPAQPGTEKHEEKNTETKRPFQRRARKAKETANAAAAAQIEKPENTASGSEEKAKASAGAARQKQRQNTRRRIKPEADAKAEADVSLERTEKAETAVPQKRGEQPRTHAGKGGNGKRSDARIKAEAKEQSIPLLETPEARTQEAEAEPAEKENKPQSRSRAKKPGSRREPRAQDAALNTQKKAGTAETKAKRGALEKAGTAETAEKENKSDKPVKTEKSAAKPLMGRNQMVDLKGFLEDLTFHPEAHKNELPPVLSEMQEELDLLEGRGRRQKSPRKKTNKAQQKPKHLRIIPLGGLEQIGMNITAFEYGDSIIVVDCGMAFPEDDMLGIDLVIPDISYLKKNMSKVKGFFITHGHEDHIGALPYVLRELNVPVYSTKLTIALIVNKLREAELLDSAKLNVVKHGDIVPAGDFQVEFIKTNHSIQDASALAIHCPAGIVLHTGDFKVDYTPVFGDVIDLQRFAELGRQGVLAVMADSTNALRPGFTMSERTVGHTFDTIFAEHPKNRIIIATFASNVDRVQQVINDAEKYDRKVVIEGRSMVNVIGTAAELGYIKIKDGTLIDISQLKDYPPEKTVLVTTGSQGEAMAALSRMASGQHRKVTIMPNDVIVLSSNPIPGNEKAVAKVINELAQKHAEVINQDTHVSGHACQEELKLIYSLVRPKYAIPVHGEYRHRIAQRNIAESVGIPRDNILIAETGDVIELGGDCCKIIDHVQAGPVMVDGLGVGDVGNIVLRDRQNLAQNGIIIVVLALEKYSGRLVAGPDIVSRGFVYVRENEELMEEARMAVMDAVDDCLVHHVSDWSRIKNVIRDTLSDFLWRRMKRTPVILPIISEV